MIPGLLFKCYGSIDWLHETDYAFAILPLEAGTFYKYLRTLQTASTELSASSPDFRYISAARSEVTFHSVDELKKVCTEETLELLDNDDYYVLPDISKLRQGTFAELLHVTPHDFWWSLDVGDSVGVVYTAIHAIDWFDRCSKCDSLKTEHEPTSLKCLFQPTQYQAWSHEMAEHVPA